VMAGVSGGMRRALRGARERLWGLWAWAILGVFALGAAALSWLPDTGWRRGALRACARGALRLSALPVRLEGLERLQGADPMVVVANHASYVDALVLYAILPPRFGFVAKQELTRHASVARLLRAAGARFVERFDPGRGIEDARELTRAAQAGEPLVFFPEGTFRRNPGLRPFRMGAFVAAACSGLPVVPVALRGTRSVLRAGEWMPRREPVEVRVGPSLRPRGEDWGAAVALRDEARSWMLPACGEPDLEAEALEQAPPA
jgi:1-acyl-sn-glycerol-3-phosphate acyltransferase